LKSRNTAVIWLKQSKVNQSKNNLTGFPRRRWHYDPSKRWIYLLINPA